MAADQDWREILGPMSDEELEVDRRVVRAHLRISTLRLGSLRVRRGVSEAVVADALDVSQPNVSRIENQDDIRLSTLAHYIAALGGELQIQAIFPDETVGLLHDPPPPAR